jgi:hypothetical protein
MRFVLPAVLICLPLIAQPPQNTDPSTTLGLRNGRVWNALTADERILFLTGASNILIGINSDEFSNYFPGGLTAGEFAKAVNQFYGDPTNLPIPIVYAMRVVTLKASGATASAVEDLTAFMRSKSTQTSK